MSSADVDTAAPPVSFVPGSFRHTVLVASKRFKSSWVELGKLLAKVHDEGLFDGWGFGSFEEYALKELRIRSSTAFKLIKSYSFLNKHEPKAMEREDIAQTAPAFEVVEVLAGAEQRGQLSAQDYKSIRDAIWNPEKSVSELKREFTTQFPKEEAEPSKGEALKRLAAQAQKLVDALAANGKVPKAVVERAKALVDDLEALA
jgi:hypothetical protein